MRLGGLAIGPARRGWRPSPDRNTQKPRHARAHLAPCAENRAASLPRPHARPLNLRRHSQRALSDDCPSVRICASRQGAFIVLAGRFAWCGKRVTASRNASTLYHLKVDVRLGIQRLRAPEKHRVPFIHRLSAAGIPSRIKKRSIIPRRPPPRHKRDTFVRGL